MEVAGRDGWGKSAVEAVGLVSKPAAWLPLSGELVIGPLDSGAHDGVGSEVSRVEWKESSSSISSSSLRSLLSSSNVWLPSAGIAVGSGDRMLRSVEGSGVRGSTSLPPAPETLPDLPSLSCFAASSSDDRAAFFEVLVVLLILVITKFHDSHSSQSAAFSV